MVSVVPEIVAEVINVFTSVDISFFVILLKVEVPDIPFVESVPKYSEPEPPSLTDRFFEPTELKALVRLMLKLYDLPVPSSKYELRHELLFAVREEWVIDIPLAFPTNVTVQVAVQPPSREVAVMMI